MRRLLAAGATTAAAVGLAVVTAAPASAAPEGQILGADSANAVDGSYIVAYKDGAAAEAASTAASLGSKVTHKYSAVLNGGFAASMSEQQAKELAADPDVAFVQQNQTLSITTDQPNPPSWGLDRIDQRSLPLNSNYSYTTTASNVHAYIIDTGMDLDHSAYTGRSTSGFDAIDGGTAEDGHGHGTHVAGTVGGTTFGVAKGVQLVAVRVLNNSGSGTTAQVVAGINWVTQNAIKPAVANMSLGGGADSALDSAVADSIASGVTYAIASGNSNANACTFSPARVPTAITVNASTNTDARASFSNFGNCTDIFAPGQNITSSWLANGTNTISGTSMATPHVAGGAALYLADHPAAAPAEVAAALVANGTTGKITSPGTGSPNVLLYTGTGGAEPPPSNGACAAASNGTDFAINDNSTVNSPITISGCTGTASTGSTVAVSIVHTYIGDLVVSLVAPDGSVYTLHNREGGSTDNLNQTYTVNLSTETANGTWNLRVQDAASIDTGRIDTWTLDL
ncbi:MAG TPA: S8 family serine peptidase [Actinophytocola sp.]